MHKNDSSIPPVLWRPDEQSIERSNLKDYQDWLERNRGLAFGAYHEMWQWSVDEPAAFWQTIWDYFKIISHTPPNRVMSDDPMPGTKWFEGSRLNYAEHIFRSRTADHPAILFQSETQSLMEVSWEELYLKVASLSAYLKRIGVKKGDAVVAFLPNIPEATIAFLAVCSIGAVWSACSPDFGTDSVVDRFRQIEPKVLFAVDGYQYGGKAFNKLGIVRELCAELSKVEKVILVPYLDKALSPSVIPNGVLWEETMVKKAPVLHFEALPFDHPIWVLYSSGTTGIPKAITHSHGGVLLEHYKYLAFHNDVLPGECFFWFSTTGWMMWNFVQAALLLGATIVLYDGSPAYPSLNVLWELSEKANIHHFGTSAPYLMACMKQGLQPGKQFDLGALRSMGATGAPLPPEAFAWVYKKIKSALWLCSMSGGTDVCTAFVGGCPFEPVYLGEIQCRALGCALYSFDQKGEPVIDEVGEMVISKPMPSMPIYFWNDEGKKRYLDSYFDMYPGIWRHGDWLLITSRNTLIIHGRSDATLNRHGIRIGTAEIYRAVNKIEEITDSLIVNLELSGGRHYMPLFVLLNEGEKLTEQLKQKIKKRLRNDYSPRHVPDEIIEIEEIPYTISGKKLEAPVKKILLGILPEKAANVDSMKNPASLDFFIEFGKGIEK